MEIIISLLDFFFGWVARRKNFIIPKWVHAVPFGIAALLFVFIGGNWTKQVLFGEPSTESRLQGTKMDTPAKSPDMDRRKQEIMKKFPMQQKNLVFSEMLIAFFGLFLLCGAIFFLLDFGLVFCLLFTNSILGIPHFEKREKNNTLQA